MDEQGRNSGKKPTTNSSLPAGKIAAVAVLAIVVGVVGFAGGVQYQKSHGNKAALAAGNRFGQSGPGGAGFRQNGSFGSVTAISAASISVKNQRSGSDKTYSIDSSTTITNDGSTASYSDIKVGDNVLVSSSSSTSTAATRILLNPSMGGSGQGAGSAGSDQSTDQTQ